MSTPLALTDLNTEVNHEPRVADLRLAEALGFERPRKIRELIKRNQEALERFGSVCPTWGKPGSTGGRPSQSFWLNRKQALFITARSDTPTAADVTVQMVEIFDAWQAGQLATVAPPPELAPGQLLMRVGSRVVLVDATNYAIGPSDEAVVCGHDGKVKIVRGPLELRTDSPWMGKRYAAGRWRKAKPNSGGIVRERPSFTIIGRLVRAGEGRRLARA